MLGEHWSGGVGDWSALAEQADTVLSRAAAVLDPLVERFDGARIVDVVGTGAAAGAAGEGALILREAARAHTATHDTYNYLHGPMEPLDPATAVVVVGEGRELRLARDVSALGCPTVLVTADGGVSAEGDLRVVTLPTTASPLAAEVLRILPFQLLALRLAERRGLAVEGFRYHQDDTKLGEA
jgi:glucosamine--fructose-6-phosphate aminotransferase (isomerizing)